MRAAAGARSGPVAASVDPRADLLCHRGCDTTRATVDAVLAAVGDQLPIADGRPGAGSCGTCGWPLDLPMRSSVRSVTVEPPSSEPFTLTFSLPLVRCGDCGADNVAPGLTDELRRSALEACGLPSDISLRARLARLLSRRRRRDAPGSRAPA
jgi:hypothetical protein